nr:MAG TPA: hypothetical protein [Caudoviricetes sp.]
MSAKHKALVIGGGIVFNGYQSVERIMQCRSARERYKGPINLANAKRAAMIQRKFGHMYIDDQTGTEVDLSSLSQQHRSVVDAVYWHDTKGISLVIGDFLVWFPPSRLSDCPANALDKITANLL